MLLLKNGSCHALAEVVSAALTCHRVGQLTASIAHEIKQPIATARNNARAALNFLGMHPPDLSEVKEALDCIVADADRAGDIVDRIGSCIKKAPPRKEVVDLNAAILEVTDLTHGEAVKDRRHGEHATGGRIATHPMRSGETATSDVELDRQCHSVDEWR